MAENKEISKMLESYFQASGSLQRRNTLSQDNWHAGCEAYANRDYHRAIDEFKFGDHSKMLYNLGMSYLSISSNDAAKEAFSKALGKDRFFALGWFQRGYCDFLSGDYASSFQDYIMARKLLHENASIDYSKIGCQFELKKSEILYNLALVHLQLGNLDEAGKAINEGKALAEKSSTRIDFDGLRSLKGNPGVPIFSHGVIFHPPILASASKARTNTAPEKVALVKDDLADTLRQKIRVLEEGDQAQIYQLLHTLKKVYGDEVLLVKNLPDISGREDFLVKQMVELRDIVYNKNVSKTLVRHGKELLRSSDKRAEKWKLWCDMFSEHSVTGKEDAFVAKFLKSDVARASLLSICSNPATDDEDLYLLQIFSFLLLPTLKAEHVLEFVNVLSGCTKKNEELTKLVVNAILSMENLAPTHSGDATAIFPSFLLSLELQENALHCKQLKTSSTVLLQLDQSVRVLVGDLTKEHDRVETEFSEKSQRANEKIGQLDQEIEELRSKLAQQASEIQVTTSALNAKKVQKKAKEDKLGLVRQDRAEYLKVKGEEEHKIENKFALTREKIEKFNKSVNALEIFNGRLRVTVTKLIEKFIPTMIRLISAQETNLQFLATKFRNYQSSGAEFRSEHDIRAKLRAAFANCAQHFRVIVHNTQILALSAAALASAVEGTAEWDTARTQVDEASKRISGLEEMAEEMEAQFRISRGGDE